MPQQGIERLVENIRTGDTDVLVRSCAEVLRLWKSAPVEKLLSLKEQFRKLDMEHREAHLEELLVSIAEKRPGPFTAIVTEPGHPLWRPALEVLALLDGDDYLDLFVSLIPLCPDKELVGLVKAIGSYRCSKSAMALTGLLSSENDEVFLEAALALKRCGGPAVLRSLKDTLEKKRAQGSPMASIVEALIRELESGFAPGEKLSGAAG